MAERRSYMCMCVRGALANIPYPRGYRGMFKTDDGRTMSPAEARDQLMSELAKGRETIPMSPKCGNPCSQPGCAGFDYGAGGGCPGHDVPAEAEAPEVSNG